MKKILIFTMLLFIVTTLCSCDNMDLKEDITETIVEKILGDNARVEITYSSSTPNITPQPTPEQTQVISGEAVSGNNAKEDNITWPKNIPDDVPRTTLEIVNKVKTPNGVILDFGEVEKITAIQYSARLKNDQYETIHEEIDDKKIDATYKKGEIAAKIYWYKDGAFTLMLTWD